MIKSMFLNETKKASNTIRDTFISVPADLLQASSGMYDCFLAFGALSNFICFFFSSIFFVGVGEICLILIPVSLNCNN